MHQLDVYSLKAIAPADTGDLVAAAEDALARLDERLAASPIRDAWIARTHLLDAAASQYLDGDLVTLEDLALHDAAADVRAPTHALTRCHTLLRQRRRIAIQPAGWALTAAALASLRGVPQDHSPDAARPPDDPIGAEDAALAAEFAALDAIMARSNRTLAGFSPQPPPDTADPVLDALLTKPDTKDAVADWLALCQRTSGAPTQAAAAASVAWTRLGSDQALGRLLVADFLRARKKARSHLPCLSLGLRSVRATQPVGRVLREEHWLQAIIAAAEIGQKQHDQWMTARMLLERKLVGRRGNSRLPALVELVMARGVISAAVVASELGVSQRGALDLIGALELRELSGRGRYRVWAVL